MSNFITLKSIILVAIVVAIAVAGIGVFFHKKKPDEKPTQNSVATIEQSTTEVTKAKTDNPQKKPENKPPQNSVAKTKQSMTGVTNVEHKGEFSSKADTVAGKLAVAVVKKDTGPDLWVVTLNGNSVLKYDGGGEDVGFRKILDLGDTTVVLMLVDFSGGQIEGSICRFLTVKKSGAVQITDWLGDSCAGETLTVEGSKITVSMPTQDRNATGTESWIYQDGKLSGPIKDIKPKFNISEKDLVKIDLDSSRNNHLRLPGKIVRLPPRPNEGTGPELELKLQIPVMFNGVIQDTVLIEPKNIPEGTAGTFDVLVDKGPHSINYQPLITKIVKVSSSMEKPLKVAETKKSIVGNWKCQTHSPDGSTSQETYTFGSDGSYASSGGGYGISGSYVMSGNGFVLTAEAVSNGTIVMSSNMAIDVTIAKLNEKELQFESIVRRSGSKRSSSCLRVANRKESSNQSPQQKETSPPSTNSKKLIVGSWNCQTRNPDGSTGQDSYTFYSGGSWVLSEGGSGTLISGNSVMSGNRLVMTAERINTGTIAMSSNLAFDVTIAKLNEKELQFESIVRRSGSKRNSSCLRVAER